MGKQTEDWKMTTFQENIWNLEIAMKESAVCNEGGYFYSEELTDYAIWQEVMRAILQSASALRLQVHAQGRLYEEPYHTYELPYFDRSHCSKEAIVQEMEQWIQTPFSCIDEPLYECCYVKAEHGMYMFGKFHHLIMDGVSFPIFLKRQERYYLEYCETGSIAIVPDDKFKEEIQRQTEVECEDTEPFFRMTSDGRARHLVEQIPESIATLMQQRTRELHITAESVVFAAASVLLGRYTGKHSVSIGRSVLNRQRNQMDSIGMYMNTQTVLCQMTGKSGEAFLSEVSATLRSQLGTMGYAFSQWKTDTRKNGLAYELSISYRNQRFLPKMEKSSVVELFCGYLEIPLRIKWNEDKTATEAELEYAVADWEEADARLFLRRLYQIIQALLETPEQQVEELDIFCTEDKFVQNKQQGLPWNYEKSVPALFIDAMAEHLEEVVLQDGTRTMTGAEVLETCAAFVEVLESRGLEKGELVGLYTGRTIYLPILMQAVMIAGGAFLQIAWQETAERRERLAQFCQIVFTKEILEVCLAQKQELCKRISRDWDWNKNRNRNRNTNRNTNKNRDTNLARILEYLKKKANAIQKEDRAYAVSTSGTTGLPKIAVLAHDSLACRLLWQADLLGKGGTYFQKTRVSFDVSVWELLLPLINDGKLYVSEEGREMDCAYLADCMEQENVTIVHFVPSVLQVFLDYTQQRTQVLADVRHVICSGERLYGKQAERCREVFPNARIWNLYGPAECTVDVSFYESCKQEADIPIGYSVWGTTLSVVNRFGQEVPQGVEGEICIGGTLVGIGYLPNSASSESNRKFTVLDGRKVYLTGDRGKMRADGALCYLGRMDSEAKMRGMRVNLSDIEQALEAYPEIQQASAFVKEGTLVACYTAAKQLDSKAIREQLKKQLPYYSVPDLFQKIDTFPLGKNGKKDKQALEQLVSLACQNKTKEACEDEEVNRDNGYNGYNKELSLLTSMVQSHIGGRAIRSEESVLEAGLTSLEAVRLTMELENAGYPISYQDIYEGQSIEGIWRICKQKKQKQQAVSENICKEIQEDVPKQYKQEEYVPKRHINDVPITVLGKERAGTKVLLCFPYAAGGAECFQKINEGLRGTEVQVWVVRICEMPDRDYRDIAKAVLRRIPNHCEIHLFGYCIGTAAAFACLDEAFRIGRNVQSMWLCGAYPYQTIKIRTKEYTLWDWLPPKQAECMMEKLYGNAISFEGTYEQFRREAKRAQQFMRTYHQQHQRYEVPTMILYGDKDPMTPMYPMVASVFHRYLKSAFRIYRLKNQGHYFMETEGKHIGRLIQKTIC